MVLAFARSIAETTRHPLLVLDTRQVVVAANTAYYFAFDAKPADTLGRCLFELAGGIWDTVKLRTLLHEIVPNDGKFDGLELEQEFPKLGRRIMVLQRPPRKTR